MNEEFLESKKIFIDKFQKEVCKECFVKCFDINEPGLDKQCFGICFNKYILTAGQVLEWLKNKSEIYQTKHFYKIFAKIDPFTIISFDPKGVAYKNGMPPYVYAREMWGKKSF